MGYHVQRQKGDAVAWEVIKNGQAVYTATSEAEVIAYLRRIGVFPPDDKGPKQWRPFSPLTPEEVDRCIILEREKVGGVRRTPADCLRMIGRDPLEIETLARVSEREADGICELRRYGWSYRKIAELTGRNINTVAKVINDDLANGRRSDKKWRCRDCGALNRLDQCETCRINRLANSRRLNLRDSRRHAIDWYRKVNNKPRRVTT